MPDDYYELIIIGPAEAEADADGDAERGEPTADLSLTHLFDFSDVTWEPAVRAR